MYAYFCVEYITFEIQKKFFWNVLRTHKGKNNMDNINRETKSEKKWYV